MTSNAARPLIGWREWAQLPDLNLSKVNAKIDTGAETSALHAVDLQQRVVDGEVYMAFYFPQPGEGAGKDILCRAPLADERIIRSANKVVELRPVVRTRVKLGGRVWEIDLSLTDRSAMQFPLLIGRNALGRRFHIEPDGSYLSAIV